jgi:hypothetical protein
MAFRNLSRLDKKWIELEQNFIKGENFKSNDDKWEFGKKEFIL